MKRLCISALPAAAAIIAAVSAQAQVVDPALLAKVDALPIDRMCSKDGVYQYRFGSTDLPPSLMPMPGFDQRALPESARPFERVGLSATKWSNRFYGADFEAHFANRATALAVIDHLARRFESLGWTARRHVPGHDNATDDISLLDAAPEEGDVHLYADQAGMKADPPTGIRANFDRLGTAVTFSCDDLALLSMQIHEALGDLPPGTPKPILPKMPRPQSLDPSICSTGSGQGQVDQFLGGSPDAMSRYVATVSGYRERIVTWKSDRLRKSGKVSDERLMALATDGLTRGSPGGDPMKGLTAAIGLVDNAQRYATLHEAGDKAGACRAGIALLKGAEAAEAFTRPQWAAMEAALDTEARKVGVSFD